ncbi:MAG: putative metal-binding motif-containing protein [Myxococcota bacterium]
MSRAPVRRDLGRLLEEGVIVVNRDGYSVGCVVVSDADCNDSSDATYPGAPEICDRDDNDCNGIYNDIPAADLDEIEPNDTSSLSQAIGTLSSSPLVFRGIPNQDGDSL